MKQLLAMCVLVACLAILHNHPSCPTFGTLTNSERPIVNVPVALRQPNWIGSKNQGCCTFATLCTDLNWMGQEAKARYIRANYGNGQTPQQLANSMAKLNIPFSWTVGDEDVAFLEQAIAGRRGVMVAIDEGNPDDNECHMVLLAHLDAYSACLIDPNRPRENRWMTREAFLHEWIETGSWAVVPLYAPAPPLVTR